MKTKIVELLKVHGLFDLSEDEISKVEEKRPDCYYVEFFYGETSENFTMCVYIKGDEMYGQVEWCGYCVAWKDSIDEIVEFIKECVTPIDVL